MFFLPMIDLNPSDAACIHSTLSFVCDHGKRYHVTPVITFDQPLWWKALAIIGSEPEGSDFREIVLRLGAFHTLMSFLGAIGYLMAGSGLWHLLELIYSTNTVTHMFSGKAYERAFRGHILADAALNTLLVNKLFGSLTDTTLHGGGEPSTHAEDEETETHCCRDLPHVDIVNDEAVIKVTDTGDASVDLGDVQKLYDALTSGEISVESVASADVLRTVELAMPMSKEKDSMKDLRTAHLWQQYMDMIYILRNFIRSERIGDWTLYIQTLRNVTLSRCCRTQFLRQVHLCLLAAACQTLSAATRSATAFYGGSSCRAPL